LAQPIVQRKQFISNTLESTAVTVRKACTGTHRA